MEDEAIIQSCKALGLKPQTLMCPRELYAICLRMETIIAAITNAVYVSHICRCDHHENEATTQSCKVLRLQTLNLNAVTQTICYLTADGNHNGG